MGVEVAEELAAPLPQCPSEAGDFGDRAGGEGVENLLGDGSSGGVAVLVVGAPDLLGAGPGDLDLDVSLVECERRYEPGVLAVGEVPLAGAQDVPHPIQRVVPPATVAVDVLLLVVCPVGFSGVGTMISSIGWPF